MTAVHLVTSAAPADGRGHLSRSLTMAEALRGADADVTLELLAGAPTAGEWARLDAIGVRVDHAPDDATVLVDLPDPNGVADRWPAERVAVFDDREWLRGSAALVIQPSLGRWSGSANADRVLEGYDYAPVRSTLRRLAAEPPPAAPRPARGGPGDVVVCFGGSDPADVSARLAPAIAAGGSWPTTVIVGPGYVGSLEAASGDPARNRGFSVHRDPHDLDTRLATAALVVCGGGTMKFEAAVLGRPMVLVAVSEDQLPVAPAFAATGAARYLGDGRTIEPRSVAAAVGELMGDSGRRAELGQRARTVIDGRGAERVAEAVLELVRR
jgi:UDP-2,4-diacetamido-2,4,6-trideoxy-beta-L-altropyranose hydrolase